MKEWPSDGGAHTAPHRPTPPSSFPHNLGFSLHASLPLFFPLYISFYSLEEAGNNSIFNYSIQRSAKVSAHWRAALEQRREHGSWRRAGCVRRREKGKPASAAGGNRLLILQMKGQEAEITSRNRRLRSSNAALCQRGSAVSSQQFGFVLASTEKQLEDSFIAVVLLPTAFGPPATLPTPQFLCQTYIEIFPSLRFHFWIAGSQDGVHGCFSPSIRNLKHHAIVQP